MGLFLLGMVMVLGVWLWPYVHDTLDAWGVFVVLIALCGLCVLAGRL